MLFQEKSEFISPIFFSFTHALGFFGLDFFVAIFFKPLVILTKTGLG